MRFDFGKLHKIGAGQEKQIFEHPTDPAKVVARFRESRESKRQTPSQMRGRYYLSKVLHLIFPKFVPNMHCSGLSESGEVFVSEYRTLDAEHIRHNDLRMRVLEETVDKEERAKLEEEELAIRSERKAAQAGDVELQELKGELKSLGVFFDSSSSNYGHDEDGDPVYVDNTFVPWIEGTRSGMFRMYNPEKLAVAIESIDDDDRRDQARRHFERLEALYKETKDSLEGEGTQ